MNLISMDKQVNLEDIEKEIDSIAQGLKAGRDNVDFPARWKKAKERLLEIQGVFQGDLGKWHHNLSVLERDSSGKLRESRQTAGIQIDKIKKLLVDAGSALDYCHHINKKAESAARIVKTDSPVSTSDVTFQTIALLDAERYGAAADNEAVVKYPRPDLGSPTNQRNCSIADKIRIGSGNSVPSGRTDYRITIPNFYHNFHGGNV